MSGRAPRQASGATGPSSAVEQRLGVRPGDRQHRDLGQGRRLVERDAVDPVDRARARRGRVARVERHVHHRAALDAVGAPVAALRVGVADEEPVVPRVGVEDAADGAVLGGDLRLDAAPGAAVAGDHDLAADVDSAAGELVVVVGHAVVDVDQLAGHVTVHRVGVVGRELLVLLARGGVLGQGGLGEGRLEARSARAAPPIALSARGRERRTPRSRSGSPRSGRGRP